MPATSAVNPQEYALFFLKPREKHPDTAVIRIVYSSSGIALLPSKAAFHFMNEHVPESVSGCVISCHGEPGAMGLAAFSEENVRQG